MSVEAECFKVRRLRESVLVRSDRVLRGSSEKLPYLQQISILATCDIDNSSGTIRLKTPIRRNRNLSVTLFDNYDDMKGHKISYDEPIRIIGEQELYIFYKTEKREIVIYLNQESQSEDNARPVDLDHLVPVI